MRNWKADHPARVQRGRPPIWGAADTRPSGKHQHTHGTPGRDDTDAQTAILPMLPRKAVVHWPWRASAGFPASMMPRATIAVPLPADRTRAARPAVAWSLATRPPRRATPRGGRFARAEGVGRGRVAGTHARREPAPQVA